MTSIVAGRDIVDRETTDSYEALELLQMSTIHDLVKTLTSKVDGITSKVNSLTSKVDRNSGQIGGIVNALDAKIKNLSPAELSYGYLEYTKYAGKIYPRANSGHLDMAHTSIGQCAAFCLKAKKERNGEDWNSFSYRPNDGYCYCWKSGRSFAGNGGYMTYNLEN